jgi:hypothetical protein
MQQCSANMCKNHYNTKPGNNGQTVKMSSQILTNQKSQPCDTTSAASFITCFTLKQVFKDISVTVQCSFKLVCIQIMLQQ